MVGTQVMKRIPRIKFPPRHQKPAGTEPSPPADQKLFSKFGTEPSPPADQKFFSKFGLTSQPEKSSSAGEPPSYRFRSDVPSPPCTTAIGGKASLLPKRTPLSEKEIEAILLGGCF